jgi:error-prone DNA polymerase
MGIVKVDLLGLGMMAVMKDSIGLIRDHYHQEVDLAHLPPNDPQVYTALQKADTIGMFQVESRAQMSFLPQMRPKRFYDIVVQVAIIRPGPIVGKMLHPFLRRRQGLEQVTYPHADLKPVLARTLGVPLFQEQLLRMAMIVAGFTGGQAEELRRALGFKRSEKRMHEVEKKLRDGMTRKGIAPDMQEVIVQSITSFALYGFPESHAASFALLAYASAYLKCRYLAAFTAAMLNNQPMGFYHPATLVKDAQRHGLHFNPVDVMRSDWKCTIEEQDGVKCVRLGFNYLKGMRREIAAQIVEERARAPFSSIRDVVRRVPGLRKEELKSLAEAGALNFIGDQPSHRREALWRSELDARPVGELLEPAAVEEETSPLAPMQAPERVFADYRCTGLTIGMHPMRLHREQMDQLGVTPAVDLANIPDGALVRIAGSVICRQRPGTAKGFVFVTLEDETGIANAIVMPDLFEVQKLTIVEEPFLLIEGVLQNQRGSVSVKASRAEPIRVDAAAAVSHDFH